MKCDVLVLQELSPAFTGSCDSILYQYYWMTPHA